MRRVDKRRIITIIITQGSHLFQENLANRGIVLHLVLTFWMVILNIKVSSAVLATTTIITIIRITFPNWTLIPSLLARISWATTPRTCSCTDWRNKIAEIVKIIRKSQQLLYILRRIIRRIWIQKDISLLVIILAKKSKKQRFKGICKNAIVSKAKRNYRKVVHRNKMNHGLDQRLFHQKDRLSIIHSIAQNK